MTPKEKAVNNYIKAKHNQDECIGFIDGYTQCQEDIFNELNEWIVVTLSAESKLGASNSVIETLLSVKYKIESLNKQD